MVNSIILLIYFSLLLLTYYCHLVSLFHHKEFLFILFIFIDIELSLCILFMFHLLQFMMLCRFKFLGIMIGFCSLHFLDSPLFC